MSLFGSLQGSLSVSLPTQDNDIFRQKTTVSQFIPANHFTAFAAYILAHPLHEVTLQILFIGQFLFFHPCLTQRAFPPISLAGFIASDMNIPGREQGHNLVHHILKESVDAVVSGTIDNFGVPSSQTGKHSDILLHHRTGKMRIGRQCRITVCRHINFRHYFYLAFGCIGHHFLYIFLCIEASYRGRFSGFRITPGRERQSCTIHPPGTYFRQTGIFFDFHTPAVIICQMKVKRVYFQHRHTVDDSQYILFRNKVTCRIQQ